MSRFQESMDGASGFGHVTEHSFRRVLHGDVESVRERLVYALETFDYRVLSDQPLIAKPSAEVSSCAWDVLKCLKSLTIVLQALNPTSTLVTFDYEIVNPFVTKGDRQTVERQAEAIIAIANARAMAPACASCGTDNLSDSRFCRVCGTPAIGGEPAELEVLRLTHGARYAHQTITGALIAALCVAAVAIPMILLSVSGSKGFALLIVGEIIALFWLLSGMRRLHRTLNTKKTVQQALGATAPQVIPTFRAKELPPQSAQTFVTEGTTELLAPRAGEPAVLPLKSNRANTAEIQ